VVAAAHAKAAADQLRKSGETVYEIGRVEKSSGAPEALVV